MCVWGGEREQIARRKEIWELHDFLKNVEKVMLGWQKYCWGWGNRRRDKLAFLAKRCL